ncbi:MAG TPA: ABC transporter substrate-binding protein [Candidatus Sulfotelmatobacter sp.]|nr:ABC transporter substrate-binding protein [Candidatus Sulfotelmatobacter sp.]
MISRRRLLLFAALGVLAARLPARAAGPIEGAEAFIQTLGEQALATLRTGGITLDQREAAFRGLLRQDFDVDFIARFVLGANWNRLSEEQRADYVQVFSEFVLKTYAQRLGGYSGETFAVTGARPAGDQDVVVRTRIDRPSGPPLTADWRVRVSDNRYRIIDVAVEGISMVLTQRQEFTSTINATGIPGLLETLHARVDKLPATAAR